MKSVRNTGCINQKPLKKENTLKPNLYLIEFYVKDPVTGEGGYDINFAWVYAYSRDTALRKLIQNQNNRFDEVIRIDGQPWVFPLTGDFTEGLNLFILGSPDDEMTDEEFVEDMRRYRIDHSPGGYPAVQTRQIDRLIEIIDKQREQPALKWTKELPTEPGSYWHRTTDGEVKMAQLFICNSRLYLLSSGFSPELSSITRSLTPGEWYGPLIPPK